MKSPIHLLVSLFDDVKRLMPGVRGLDRDLITIKNRFEHEGDSFLTITLPILNAALEEGLRSGRFSRPSNFRNSRKSGALPVLLQGLLENVFDSRTGCILDEPDVESIMTLRQILLMFKKLSLPSLHTRKLERLAIEKFHEVDSSIVETFDKEDLNLIRFVSSRVLRKLSLDFDGRHGPGAVYEGCKGNSKWSELINQITSDAYAPLRCTVAEYLNSNGYILDNGAIVHGNDAKSRVTFVPKTATAVRSISVEPVVLQFEQQRYNSILRESIKRCDILSNCLDLSDQSKNKELALIGSRTGAWSTLDLSSASDLLSLSLVKEIIGGVSADLLDGLIGCRSPSYEYDGVSYPMKKYAGMGNATTFPVQSICFSVIAIAAILNHAFSEQRRRGNLVAYASSCIRIYGDDIIVKSEYTHVVVDLLERFGLKLNRHKSFWTGKFRESCGCDAYDGVDVTPVYVRRLIDRSATASDFASVVSTSNQLWLRCYYATADAIRASVDSMCKLRIPLAHPNSGLMCWSDRYGSSEIHGWNSVYHSRYVSGPSVRPKWTTSKLSGVPALIKFFLTPLIERRPGHLERSVMRYKTSLRQTRVPV